ncbi:murein transglycosylase domain-containing protein [Sulfurimonas sp.]|uniref:murein transglycosylase domain-containing protein n=1 Tax=Sulfurimonas sp. TaxID=2022749 RepID=UPI0025D9D61B|nr:murein transglycosylase domain-containing protein [Sulfurimonas sp.]MDD5156786.1 murein transglycosylase domain-containing protein [Sulfurimonas sp.]
MIKKIIIISSTVTLLSAQSADDFAREQMQGFQKENSKFDTFKKETNREFENYKKAQEKAILDYKKEVGAYWDDPKLSDKKNWVSYTLDKKIRTSVDFEHEKITIEVISSNPNEARQKLRQALARVVTIDTKKVQESDPLEQKLQKIAKPDGIVDAPTKAEPILSGIMLGKSPTQNSLKEFVDKNTDDLDISSKESSKIRNDKIYTLSVKMPDNATLERSKIFYSDVKEHSLKQQIPISLIYAVIHTESCFNPYARSFIPAYGLMQIVPSSAGLDTYQFLYSEKKLMSDEYLYNSTNNITIGSAYLHILYYKYLKEIKDPQSRLYCTVAAYNTGGGNVAWAFVKSNDMKKAALIINSMTADDVYNKLLSDLKYEEPKNYLKNVLSRITIYEKIYSE